MKRLLFKSKKAVRLYLRTYKYFKVNDQVKVLKGAYVVNGYKYDYFLFPVHNKMSDFIGKKFNELVNNLMGSNSLPVFVTAIKGKNSFGFTFYSKAWAVFHAAYTTRMCKQFMHIRCKHHRQGCSWTGRLKNISGITDQTQENFWIGEGNWIFLPHHNVSAHTCGGIDFRNLCQNDFRYFVRNKYEEGFHKFSDIRRVSN